MSFAAPLLYAVFLWWFTTGAILWLDRLPRATFAWSFAAASVLGVLALGGILVSARLPGVSGAYIAFTSAIVIWGWHEMSFLMGFILGPRRQVCPPDARGWRRFRLAAATLIHHEIAIALTAVALAVLSWGQPNQIGLLTFVILWAMRLSAKLNLFLGAPHRGEELLPAHLAHLKSYFRHRTMNALFPVSMLLGATLAASLGAVAFALDAEPFEQVGFSLLLALTALALIEHAFLFVPPPNALLWGWATSGATKSIPRSPPPGGHIPTGHVD